MKRTLMLCTALLGLVACARNGMPPAPLVTPVPGAADDSLAPAVDLSALSSAGSAADAEVLNDLAASQPDEKVVPAFDGQGVRWDIDVQTYARHPRVQYYLGYFQGSARSGMAVFLSRGARYEPMIRRRFEEAGLPGDLGYLALIESGYSNDAVSRSYAVGMWQFMRGTGRGYGLRVDSWVDERRDPVKATDAAARHLRDLRERFGSLYLAAAAYNAGAGKVSRSLGKLEWDRPEAPDSAEAAADKAEDSSPDSGADSLADSPAVEDDSLADDAPASADASADDEESDSLPEAMDATSDAAFFRLASADLLAAETQDYVPKLIAAAIIAKEPGRYGFETAPAEAFAYDSLIVNDATGLDVVARLAGVSLAEIRDLNPQYLRLATPPHSEMVIRLPVGTGSRAEAAYRALPHSARIHYLTYVVRRRDRWASIAARYRLSTADVRAANPKIKSTHLKAGTRLVIPTVAIPSALAMRATGTLGGHRSAHGRYHRVRRGETLTGIARRYRVSLAALRRANTLRRDYALRAGMRIRIPG